MALRQPRKLLQQRLTQPLVLAAPIVSADSSRKSHVLGGSVGLLRPYSGANRPWSASNMPSPSNSAPTLDVKASTCGLLATPMAVLPLGDCSYITILGIYSK